MRRTWKFYAVAGFNGYGVYNDYEKVLESQQYIWGFKVKSFIDYDLTLRNAKKMYYNLQIQKFGSLHPVLQEEKYGGLNWFYRTNFEMIIPFVVWG